VNRNFNLASRQRKHNASRFYSKQKRADSLQPSPYFSTRNGFCKFSYRGIIIERGQGAYQIGRRIVISGFPVDSVSGIWTDAGMLKRAIDLGFEQACPERHKAVMEQYRNWKCPVCGSIALVDAKDIHTKWKYVTDSWGNEERIDTGIRLLTCNYCSEEVDSSDIPYVSSDVFL